MVWPTTAPVPKQSEIVFGIETKCVLKDGITGSHVPSCMGGVTGAGGSLTSMANGSKGQEQQNRFEKWRALLTSVPL